MTSLSYWLLKLSTSLASTYKPIFKGSVTMEYWYRPLLPNDGGPSFTTQSVEKINQNRLIQKKKMEKTVSSCYRTGKLFFLIMKGDRHFQEHKWNINIGG